MKKNIFKSSLALVAMIATFVVAQSFTTVKSEIIPADGCKYTDDPETFCVWGNYAVTHCANTFGSTTCGVAEEDIDPQP